MQCWGVNNGNQLIILEIFPLPFNLYIAVEVKSLYRNHVIL